MFFYLQSVIYPCNTQTTIGKFEPTQAIAAAANQLPHNVLLWIHVFKVDVRPFIRLVKFARRLTSMSNKIRTIIESPLKTPTHTSEHDVAGRFRHFRWYPVGEDEIDGFVRQTDSNAAYSNPLILKITGGLPRKVFRFLEYESKEEFLWNTMEYLQGFWERFDFNAWKQKIAPSCFYFGNLPMRRTLFPIQKYMIKNDSFDHEGDVVYGTMGRLMKFEQIAWDIEFKK